MKISTHIQDMIVQEIQFVADKMEQSSTEAETLYFFSGVNAILQRMFNIEYHEHLVYAHFILRSTHEAFVQRLKAIQGGEKTIPLYKEQFERLLSLTKELGEHLANNHEIESTLRKFIVLSYSTGGNGHYLVQKGVLKI
ncbi:MAG: hypothetical protein GY801_22050 [bacterium]|nr:hypothetical protein [bacterium]